MPRITEKTDKLPRTPLVGDRIKLKEEVHYRWTCETKACGWNLDPYAIREVIREDGFGPGGSRRLFVDGPPYAYSPQDVKLAWNSDQERREALKKAGHRV